MCEDEDFNEHFFACIFLNHHTIRLDNNQCHNVLVLVSNFSYKTCTEKKSIHVL